MTSRTGTTGDSSHDAERSVLGAMLRDPQQVRIVASVLSPAEFAHPRHAWIMRAIVQEHEHSGASDPIAVAEQLKAAGRLDECGGTDYLFDLLDSVVTATGARRHAEIVRDQAASRRIRMQAAEIVQAHEGGASLEELCRMLDDAHPPPARLETRPGRDWRQVADDPPVEWIADGLIPVAGLVVLAAEPNAGKTLLVLDVALRAAHGLEWLGRSVTPCSTVYIPAEGGRGLGVRMRAWASAHPGAAPPDGHYVHVDEGPLVDLGRADALQQLEQVLASAAAANRGRRPDVVVIDTLALALPGSDENDSGAMGMALAVLAELRRRHGVAVVVLHHLRKPHPNSKPGTGMHALRGSSALAGAADVVLLAQEGREGVRVLRTVKVRDGELLPDLHYAIRAQDTDRMRPDGRAEAGPVVLPAEATPLAGANGDQADEAARLAADVAAVVAVVAREGRVSGKDTIWRLAGLPRERGRTAVDVAVTRCALAVTGTTRDRSYVVAGGANGHPSAGTDADSRQAERARCIPRTPYAGGGANGARHPDAIPAEPRKSAQVGGNGASGPDDGLPEQPGGRRRAARGGAE